MPGKILVVDDDPIAIRLMKLALVAEGFEVATAQSAQEGTQAIQKEQPDLVIIDIMLPDMDGVEMCRRLRNQSNTAHIPIIFLTARTQLDDKIEGLRAGADDYITKPADPREVVARVEAVLARAKRVSSGGHGGRIVALLGAKGGMGTSTVAINLGVALEQQQVPTLLIDLHHSGGTIAQQLKLAVRSSLADLLSLQAEQIDGRQVERMLTLHPSGLRILPSPPGNATLFELPAAHARAIVRSVRPLADIVLLDLPHTPSPALQEISALCDMALIVLEPELLPIACAEQTIALLEKAGLRGESVALVMVNRQASTTSLPLSDIEHRLNKNCLGAIPPASTEIALADRYGTPLLLSKPQSMVASALQELAKRVQAKVSSLVLHAQ